MNSTVRSEHTDRGAYAEMCAEVRRLCQQGLTRSEAWHRVDPTNSRYSSGGRRDAAAVLATELIVSQPRPKPAAERPGIDVFKPSRTLRRAELTTDGHAVTWTLKGAIIDGLEIEYEPTLAEASDRINALYKNDTAAGVEVHAALKRALEEVPSVFARRYLA